MVLNSEAKLTTTTNLQKNVENEYKNHETISKLHIIHTHVSVSVSEWGFKDRPFFSSLNNIHPLLEHLDVSYLEYIGLRAEADW